MTFLATASIVGRCLFWDRDLHKRAKWDWLNPISLRMSTSSRIWRSIFTTVPACSS